MISTDSDDAEVLNTGMLSTGSAEFDLMLGGGLPLYSNVIIGGRQGVGKTILGQQIGYHASRRSGKRVLFLTALSEPRAKVIRNVQKFAFFDAAAFGDTIRYDEIGQSLHNCSPAEAIGFIMRLVEQHRADILVIDSMRAVTQLPGLARSARVFCHELTERLAAARCTSLFVGEYGKADLADRPELAVADGIVMLGCRADRHSVARSLKVVKMRGLAADVRTHPFHIGTAGIIVGARSSVPATATSRSAYACPALDDTMSDGTVRVPAGLASVVSFNHTV